MLPAVLIAKKRDGQMLSEQEIQQFIGGYTSGEISEGQMAAMAMAICLRGMVAEEISALTAAMLESGERLPRSVDLPRVDKHSTGGLGDKVSLILAPLLACCDVTVPMISGRGLGLSGGTLDKLDAIPGFRCDLSTEQLDRVLREVGCHIISANDRLAPADRKLYALRDVTGTVESIGLITASILCKKLAASLDALVLDVKVGSGAFMKSLEAANNLATSLVSTGRRMNLPVTALLTDMDQPLGEAIGNACEVNEALDVLRGEGPDDVRKLTIQLAAEPLITIGVCPTHEQAVRLLESKLDDGSAMDKFYQMVRAQGGSLTDTLPLKKKHAVMAAEAGYVRGIDCPLIGECIVALGGGRRRQQDKIDPSVGIQWLAATGNRVERGQTIAFLFCEDNQLADWPQRLSRAIDVSDQPVASASLVLERMEGGGG